MGQLKRFFRNVLCDRSFSYGGAIFDRLPKIEVESHLTIANYGCFTLSDAVRPSFDLKIIPRQGYKYDQYRNIKNNLSIPVIMATVSKENLFDTFIDLLDPLGNCVDVVLETSHKRSSGNHLDLYREQIDMPILKSFLYDYEELLLNDGCTGVAVLNSSMPCEVQFDEHKMLIIYAKDEKKFEKILNQHNIYRDDAIRFITEAEHIHTTKDDYYKQFQNLKITLGLDNDYFC
ncbi:MAG: hypothetical protein LBP59_06165 [Planctomycetaceae bacterium]|jgi:hypothetical protein|nr:hypothetical protein [Planctomycetaceae bacterium]